MSIYLFCYIGDNNPEGYTNILDIITLSDGEQLWLMIEH